MTILLALLALIAAASVVARLEDWGHREDRAPPFMAWFDGFLLPLGRVFALLLFIVLSYPALLDLERAPRFSALLAGEPGRFDRLVNLLFFTGLFLPAIPVLRRLPGLLLPLQGMAGVALVAGWTAAALGREIVLWPSRPLWVLIALLAGMAWLLAHLLTIAVRDRVLQQDLGDLFVLIFQAPLLLIYGHWLGRQLS